MLICTFGSAIWSCSLLTVATYIYKLMRCVLISWMTCVTVKFMWPCLPISDNIDWLYGYWLVLLYVYYLSACLVSLTNMSTILDYLGATSFLLSYFQYKYFLSNIFIYIHKCNEDRFPWNMQLLKADFKTFYCVRVIIRTQQWL